MSCCSQHRSIGSGLIRAHLEVKNEFFVGTGESTVARWPVIKQIKRPNVCLNGFWANITSCFTGKSRRFQSCQPPKDTKPTQLAFKSKSAAPLGFWRRDSFFSSFYLSILTRALTSVVVLASAPL